MTERKMNSKPSKRKSSLDVNQNSFKRNSSESNVENYDAPRKRKSLSVDKFIKPFENAPLNSGQDFNNINENHPLSRITETHETTVLSNNDQLSRIDSKHCLRNNLSKKSIRFQIRQLLNHKFSNVTLGASIQKNTNPYKQSIQHLVDLKNKKFKFKNQPSEIPRIKRARIHQTHVTNSLSYNNPNEITLRLPFLYKVGKDISGSVKPIRRNSQLISRKSAIPSRNSILRID